jgi:hypothetical protein
MKTFLFDTFNRYKRFSESLDVKTVLCNKTWFVFNNSGEREIYIFQENGKLKISLNGKVTHATWEYIPANKSLIISGNEQSYMVHATYVDNILFALQIDGAKEYAFLIDENNKYNFLPQSYNDIKRYFQIKEEKQIQKEEAERKEKELKQLEYDRLAKQKWEEEQVERKQEEENRIIQNLQSKATEIKYPSSYIVLIGIGSFFLGDFISVFLTPSHLSIGSYFINLVCYIIILFCLFFILGIYFLKKIRIMKWKKKHPNDPVNQYL